MAAPDEASIIGCDDAAALDTWLAENHDDRDEVWVRIAKKGAPTGSVTPAEAIDVALCWGWIDSQARRLDDHYYVQRFSPRRKRSPWSQVNVARVAELIAAGRMRPPGQVEIDAAKADGRWDAAYAPQSTAEVPPDLAAALESRPAARTAFDALSRSDRYLLILRLAKTTTERGRAATLTRTITRLEDLERAGLDGPDGPTTIPGHNSSASP